MSTEVQLRPADIKGQLRHIMRRRDEPRPVALFGTGSACKVEVEGVIWDVRPVGSELELRAALTGTEHDNAVAFLVDYDDRLPLDVACRLAGQKVHPVDRRSRLANLFGARKVAPGFAATALADVLLEELPDVPPIAGTLLQPDDAWRRYLAVHLELPVDTEPDLAGLLRLALMHREAGQRFGARRDDEVWGRLLDEAASWMGRRLGPAGTTVWTAWTTGTAADVVAWLVHIDAARRAKDKLATRLLRQVLRVLPGTEEAWLEEVLSAPLCDALDSLLKSLDAKPLGEILHRAGQLFDDPDFAAARRASPWLAEGFDALQDELAAALEGALRSYDALPVALQVFRHLEEHNQAKAGSSAERIQQTRSAALQLLTWLAWLEKQPLPDEPGWTCMSALASWYDEEGGWVDWAREELRTQTTNHAALDEAHRQVLERADQVRRELDRRFARATLAWYDAGKPATEVLPIERVTRDVAAAFLDEQANRRLLVVLLDGMSVSVATRLLEAQDGWAPVMWTPKKHRQMPPAIASLPSVTATSRAAFFAGKSEPRFGGESESKDVSRFADNPFLREFVGTSAGPRLFLKPDLGSSNELAVPLLDALRDEAERVVAVVVNAIDDQLKGSDQITVPYEQPHAIPVLERLLRVARETERAVLLVSDHGHIPAHVMKGNKPPEDTKANGHRWRSLGPGQAPQEAEVELPDGCWKPRGAKGSALFWDERRAWGNAVYGAHGGLTLAECVIPVRLLAPDWLFSVMQPPDDNVRTQEQRPPRWWRLEAPPTSTRRPTPAPKTPSSQGSLFPTKPPPKKTVAPPEVVAEQHPLAAALAKSELFKAKALGQPEDKRDMALTFVDALLRAPGYALSRAAFARAVGIKTRRVTSRIADIGFLNTDGFTVVEEDPTARQVRLHFDRLTAQYGLDA